MFISTKEKELIEFRFNESSKIVGSLITELALLKNRIFILEKKLEKPVKVKKPLTEAQKAKQREYQRAYQARRKAQKLTEGNTNVSA